MAVQRSNLYVKRLNTEALKYYKSRFHTVIKQNELLKNLLFNRIIFTFKPQKNQS